MTHDPCPMHLPRLPSLNHSHVHVIGDVKIDPTAAIAPGVILQADPDSKIIIAAGACIGMGAILHAHQGILEVEAGAILGAGVLVIGVARIGSNACIGSTTTIWNSSVAPASVIPAGSLIGETGRQVAPPVASETETPPPVTHEVKVAASVSEEEVQPPPATEEVKAATPEPIPPATPATTTTNETEPKSEVVKNATTETVKTPRYRSANTNGQVPSASEPEAPQPSQSESSRPRVGVTVYGHLHLNRLMLTLFPHQKPLDNPPQDSQNS